MNEQIGNKINDKTYIKLTPFKGFVLENFPFIEADFDAITNYQLLCKVIEYLNNVISNQNTVQELGTDLVNAYNSLVDAVNLAINEFETDVTTDINQFKVDINNDFDEFTSNITTQFNNLKNYVDNYFDNNFPELVSDKLDEMAEDGTLENLINDTAHLIKVYNTYTDMMADSSTFTNGLRLKTLGYYTLNDGGGADYYVNNSVIQNTYQIELSNDLYLNIVNNNTINIKQLGAYGDGIHNDTSAFENAINNFVIINLDKGTYLVDGNINIKSHTQIIGQGMNNTLITTTTNNYIFKYITDVSSSRYDIKTSILFKDFKVNCHNFFKINDGSYEWGTWELQASILHVIVENLYVIGNYSTLTDANKDSNVLPLLNELTSYGICFDFNNVFDSQIINCNIEDFGIGVYLKGCDINKIEHNRFTINATHLYTERIGTYGSQTIFSHNDVLANKRYGGIRINETTGDLIEDNYFETYTNASCYIYANAEQELSIIENRITNPGVNNIDVIVISPRRSDFITGNRSGARDLNMYVHIDYTNTLLFTNANSHRNNTVLYFLNNDTNLMLKDEIYVITENYNPLVISPYNIKYDNARLDGSAYLISQPFTLNSDYNLYGFNNVSGTGQITFKNALKYYAKPLKIRYYYISSEATQFYRVTSVDDVELNRGSLTNLTADGKMHVVEDDLTSLNSVGNTIYLQLPTVPTLQLMKIELI